MQRGGVVVAYRVVSGGDIVGCQRCFDVYSGWCHYTIFVRRIDRTPPTRINVDADICPFDGQAVAGGCQDNGEVEELAADSAQAVAAECTS